MTRKIGAHVSASGGLEKAIERAHAIGANCAQIFSGSPRVWKRPAMAGIKTEKMFAIQKTLHVGPIFTHSLYLINLASENPELLAKSNAALCFDMEFDARIGGSGIVVHLGSHQKRGWEAVRDQVADQIADILAHTPETATFLIENSAGQSGKLCSDLSEIHWLLAEVTQRVQQLGFPSVKVEQRLGWCLDTCHAHAAGYILGSSGEKSQSLETTITNLGLWDSLRCIHVNDSKDAPASGRDRHENLLQGTIPEADLRHFLRLPQVMAVPLILEVPGLEGNGPDAHNVSILQQLCLAE